MKKTNIRLSFFHIKNCFFVVLFLLVLIFRVESHATGQKIPCGRLFATHLTKTERLAPEVKKRISFFEEYFDRKFVEEILREGDPLGIQSIPSLDGFKSMVQVLESYIGPEKTNEILRTIKNDSPDYNELKSAPPLFHTRSKDLMVVLQTLEQWVGKKEVRFFLETRSIDMNKAKIALILSNNPEVFENFKMVANFVEHYFGKEVLQSLLTDKYVGTIAMLTMALFPQYAKNFREMSEKLHFIEFYKGKDTALDVLGGIKNAFTAPKLENHFTYLRLQMDSLIGPYH